VDDVLFETPMERPGALGGTVGSGEIVRSTEVPGEGEGERRSETETGEDGLKQGGEQVAEPPAERIAPDGAPVRPPGQLDGRRVGDLIAHGRVILWPIFTFERPMDDRPGRER
jgi:hypothetical protein